MAESDSAHARIFHRHRERSRLAIDSVQHVGRLSLTATGRTAAPVAPGTALSTPSLVRGTRHAPVIQQNRRFSIEKLARHHALETFDCGQDALNRFLTRRAPQSASQRLADLPRIGQHNGGGLYTLVVEGRLCGCPRAAHQRARTTSSPVDVARSTGGRCGMEGPGVVPVYRRTPCAGRYRWPTSSASAPWRPTRRTMRPAPSTSTSGSSPPEISAERSQSAKAEVQGQLNSRDSIPN